MASARSRKSSLSNFYFKIPIGKEVIKLFMHECTAAFKIMKCQGTGI
jgi:hypothetical protein